MTRGLTYWRVDVSRLKDCLVFQRLDVSMDTVIPLRLAAGFRRGSHRRSNGFVRFDFTELQEAVVILGVLHSTQWTG
jgi:hypothetical protein